MYAHDDLTEAIIGCGIAVHRELGPGLPESTCEEAFCIELAEAGLAFDRQIRVPVFYRGRQIGEYRPDVVIEKRVVVEIKRVERLIGVHRAQLLAYMRVLKLPVGLLMNFNTELMRDGIKRVAL
jgi:GxxExxY protein